MSAATPPRSRWRRWVLPAAALLGVGPWGGLAGAALFWLVADAVGVSFSEEGGLFPPLGPSLWLLAGLTLGYAVSAWGAWRLMQRSPRALGGIVGVLALLTVVSTLADRSGWDGLYLWLPGLVLAGLLVRFGQIRSTADERPAPEGMHPGRRRALLIAGGALVVAAASIGWLLLSREEPRSVSVEEARRRTGGSTATTDTSGAFGPPAGGVYVYRGEGTERTSFPPLTEAQGPTMPATVILEGAGCWRLRIDYSSHHWQDWRFCADSQGITSTGGRSFARRSFGTFKVDNTSTFTCADPEILLWAGMRIGDFRRSSCTGTSSAVDGRTTSAGPTTYLGDEDIAVGGRTIRARHLRYDRDLSGAQRGTERTEWWVDPATMLPIRNEHRIRVDTKVGTITVTYTEVASYTLTSLTPR